MAGVALVVGGDRLAVRLLAALVLLAAVVAGGVAARRHSPAVHPVGWLVMVGVTLTGVSLLGPGRPQWAAVAGTGLVAAALVLRGVQGDRRWSRSAAAGLVGVSVLAALVALGVHAGAFGHGAVTSATNLVSLAGVGVLTTRVASRSPTVPDRYVLAGAGTLFAGQLVLMVSSAAGHALTLVGAVTAVLAQAWLPVGQPGPQHPPPVLLTQPSSWRLWVPLVGSLALPVAGLVGVWSADDPRLVVAAGAQLVLVGMLVIAVLRLAYDRAHQVGRVTELAETHPVTGLANRHRFLADVTSVLDTAKTPVTVVLVALESFTELRARLGEATAESLEVACAQRLVDHARDAFAVGHLRADVVALVFDVMNAERASVRAQGFIDALREPIELPQLSMSIGAIVGMATSNPSSSAEDLLASAELALAAARGPGGPMVRFTPELERRDAVAAQLVGELSEAIAHGEVLAYFQPQLDLATNRVTGAEALVRWVHPALGLLSPAAFVPAAEVTGTVRQITVHVLDQALYWCARWSRAGRPLNVSVNLSTRDLLHARIVDDVREALARHSLPASRLELEITETAAMADVALSRRVLTDLARLGVTISIDDYGTGYGSLAYLQQLPVRRLKIDRTFVARILDDEASMAIVRSTIELAGRLGLDTVAEGVEDEATVHRLREFGCGSVQGFGLAAPMSPESFERAVWRLEHRPRPTVAAVRPRTSDSPPPPVVPPQQDAQDPGWWSEVPPSPADPARPETVPSSAAPAPVRLEKVPSPAEPAPTSGPLSTVPSPSEPDSAPAHLSTVPSPRSRASEPFEWPIPREPTRRERRQHDDESNLFSHPADPT
ncbi:MAG: EAL domain-containing protein [Micrococcales bacterium]|nr:EAL domain-containing protein [Micrococcales bacterium]MCL2668051.1 EAL domain-containing protein [Micrococcales bacterium]